MTPDLIELETVAIKLSKSVVKLIKDDLTTLSVDAFVFYAREDLALGAGYGTAIQQRGGNAVRKELEKIGRIGMGQAVVTTAGAMNAGSIIHACGPKFQEPELEAKLRVCMRSALAAAEQHKFRTVAFPPLGYGFYGVPLGLCGKVMLEEITGFLAGGDRAVEEVIVCVTDKHDYDGLKGQFEAFQSEGGQ